MKSINHWLLAAGVVCSVHAAHAQVVIVVGAKSPATALNAEQTAGLFLGRNAQLPGAGTAVLVNQSESTVIREQFYTKVAGKSAAQVKAIWSRLVFSGKALPPMELANSVEVKKLLASNPDAVGYIEKSAVDPSVKVLLTVE